MGVFWVFFNSLGGKAMGPDNVWDKNIPENENTQRIKIKNFYKFGLKHPKH